MFLFDNDTDSPADLLMDIQVWSRMPFDLLEKVLLRLPLASRARFQAVSKSVQSLLSSKRFQLEATKISVSCGRLPICALVRSDILSKKGVAVVSELEVPFKVHKFNLSFLPAEFRTKDTLGRRHHGGKGVLFFAKKLLNKKGRHMGDRICVVNPINMTWRQLPDLVVKNIALELPKFDSLCDMSLMAENERGFQVFVLHCFKPETAHCMGNPDYVYLSVYSSMTHSWTSRFIKYGRPADEVTKGNAWVTVGQEYAYALGKCANSYHRFFELEVFQASTGEPVCTPAHPPYPLECVEYGLVQLEGREVNVTVPMSRGSCKILALPDLTSRVVMNIACLEI